MMGLDDRGGGGGRNLGDICPSNLEGHKGHTFEPEGHDYVPETPKRTYPGTYSQA